MERPVFQAANRRSKNQTGRDVSCAYEHEVARLFDRFKLDLEKMFAVNRPAAARSEPGYQQRAARKRSAA